MGKPILLAENILENATLTATSTESGYDVDNLKDRRRYTFWKADTTGTFYITADCSSSQAADTLGITGHNFGSSSAQITLQVSDDNTNWTDVITFSPSNDKSILKTFTQQTKRYWRLKIVSSISAAQLAVLFIGSKLQFPRYISGDFDPSPENPVATTARSKAGYLLGSIIRHTKITISVNFRNLTDTWIRNSFKSVWDTYLSQLKPFFWAWDIENFPDEIFYAAIPEGFALSIPYNPVRRNLHLEMETIKE